MKKLWNEYGLIAILLVVSVGGYLSLGDQKEDFLSDPLDAIGARFTQLMEDDASREEFSESYADFEKKVRDHEITPEQVEFVAASVLNLEAAGAELSPEDAKMVIAMATEPAQTVLPVPAKRPAPPSSPVPPLLAAEQSEPARASSERSSTTYRISSGDATADTSPERYREMNERMADAFALADEIEVIAREESEDGEIRSHVRYTFEDGIAVTIDSSAAHMWNRKDLQPLTKDLERKRMVTYQYGLKNKHVKVAEMEAAKRRQYAKMREQQLEESEEELFLFSLERLSKLQEMGMVVNLDTVMLRLQIEESLRQIKVEFDEMESQDDK